MSHQTADSDGSLRLDWDIAIGFTNRLQFAFTDTAAAAFNVAGYTYSVQAWKPGQSPTTANLLLSYTQGSQITNNGAAGTVDVLMSVADSELFKNNVDVLWRVKAIHPNGDVRRWYNGFIKPSRELHEGTTTGVTQSLNVDGVTVNTTVTIAAGGPVAFVDLTGQPEDNTNLAAALALKQALLNAATALVDGATIDLTAIKHTLSTAASRTFTISYTGDGITLEVTLTAVSATMTFPATALCVSEGIASGDNLLAMAGVSGDKYIIAIKKIGTAYYVVCKNFGQ